MKSAQISAYARHGTDGTAFYNDKYDYIVSRRIEVRDQTGRFVEKTFFINQDYARIRGLELALTRRVGSWFTGTLSGLTRSQQARAILPRSLHYKSANKVLSTPPKSSFLLGTGLLM